MKENKIKILLFDSNLDDQRLIKETFSHLEDAYLPLESCSQKNIAITILEKNEVNLILLGTSIIDHSGLDNLKTLVTKFPKIPVIILLDVEDEEYGKKAMQIGAQDFAAKWSLNRRLLQRIIMHAIERQKFQSELEAYRQLRISETEKNFMNLIEHNIDGMVVVDKDNEVKFVNTSAEKMVGRNESSMLGKKCEIPYFEDKTKEILIKHADDIRMIIETKSAKTRWEGREARLIILRDVTERKNYEEHISFEKTLLEYQSEASKDGILYMSADGILKSYNSRIMEMWDIKPEEIKGKSGNEVLLIISGKIKNGDFLKSKVTFICENKDEIAQGEVNLFDGKVYDVYSAPVKSSRGIYYGRMWSFYDITKRRKTEEALKESEERFRTLFENVPIGLFRTTPSGKFAMANPALVKMLGYENFEELTNLDLNKVGYSGNFDRDDFKRLMEEQGEVKGIEYKWKGPNNKEFFAKESSKIIKDNQGNALYFEGSIEDITDKRNAEEKLTKYTLELQRSNQELQDFASITSHDLKEPLRKITTFCQRLIEATLNLDEQSKMYVERITESAKRLQQLIDDILAYSRVTSGSKQFKKINLQEIINHILLDLEHKIEHSKAKIHVDKLPVIDGEQTQIQQLFQNLISNSLKFTRAEITPEITITCTKKKNSYEIIIKDNGTGFDEKYVDKIFKPFQRLHSKTQYEGSGIGLAICQKIVLYHQGSITAKSKIREGTTFYITLPEKQKESKHSVTEGEKSSSEFQSVGELKG